MKNGWEPGGPLIDVLVELSIAERMGPRPGDDDALWRVRAADVIGHARRAYVLLMEARDKAIREESEGVDYPVTSCLFGIATRNARAQAAPVTDPEKRRPSLLDVDLMDPKWAEKYDKA